MDREKLNTKISELVDVLRTEEDRRISMSDIASITEVLITTMSRYFASIDTSIYREFQDLSDHITTMRTEIARAQPKEIKAKKIPRAGRELDAVVQATEDATNTIMEAVETIMGADTTDVEAYALAVNDQCMRIFEACSFQDITGQRVTKVINTLTFIEERIGSILTAWPEGEDMVDEAPAAPEAAARPGDKELLDGPALEGEGISQNDVDSLFGEAGPPAADEAAPAEAPETAPEPEPAKAEKPASAEAPETAPEPEPAKAEKPASAEDAKAQDASPAEAAKAVVEDAGETETEVVKAVAETVGETTPAQSDGAAAEKATPTAKGPAKRNDGAAKQKPASAEKPEAAAKPKSAAAAKGNRAAAKPKPAPAKTSADDDDDEDAPKSSQDDIDALFD